MQTTSPQACNPLRHLFIAQYSKHSLASSRCGIQHFLVNSILRLSICLVFRCSTFARRQPVCQVRHIVWTASFLLHAAAQAASRLLPRTNLVAHCCAVVHSAIYSIHTIFRIVGRGSAIGSECCSCCSCNAFQPYCQLVCIAVLVSIA